MDGWRYRAIAIVSLLLAVGATERASAAVTADAGKKEQPCVIASYQGAASTYNPQCERESWSLSTGGRYNPAGWDAALQLDLAKRHRCGYMGRCYAAVENMDNGKAAILLINDNGPLHSGSYGSLNRVIDLNEASMRYLANDPRGVRYGNCKGTLPRVRVSLLCRLIGRVGPLNEEDRAAWNKIASAIPNSQLPPSFQPAISNVPSAARSNPSPNGYNAPAAGLTPPSNVSTAAPLLSSPIPQSNALAASQVLDAGASETEVQTRSISELLLALSAPTSSASSFKVAPFALTEGVSSRNVSQVSPVANSVSSSTPAESSVTQNTNTFGNTYRSEDLRFSTTSLFSPFLARVEIMVRSIIDLLKRL